MQTSAKPMSRTVASLWPDDRLSSSKIDPTRINFLPHPTSHIRSVDVAIPLRTNRETLDPSWKRWIDLVEMAVAESQQPEWATCAHVRESRSPDSPLLHGATLRVNAGRAHEFVRRLADRLGVVGTADLEPLAFILAGIERESDTVDLLARKLAISTDTAAVLAQLSALPLLLNAAQGLTLETSRTWQRGYCPVCGAWPSMVEMRGIQRERRMRCGCCGGDWMLPVLRCAFCGENDHQKLGFLMDELGEQHIRVETCATCHGYLKSMTTLSMLPYLKLATHDASTVAFDLAALDRGYARPSRPGWQLQVEIVQ